MADLKISELPVATAPAGTELIEIVQGGVNKQTTVSSIGGAVSDASETVKGIIEIATQAETNTGTDDVRALTPLKATTKFAPIASPTFTGTPAAPTAAPGTNTTQVATTAFVTALGILKVDQLTSFRRLTASHTLDSTDLAAINTGDDVVIELNVASANDLTIPLNATVAFPVGTKLTIIQYGVGQTSVVATGGVTVNTSSGDFLSRNQYAPMLLEKVATDEWYLSNGTTPGSIVSSGTYTPALTNTTNVAASTAYACQYLRIGATVSVSGKVSIDPTTTGDTVLGMSIPIASAFSQEFHAGGSAIAYAVAGLSVAIFADATNDRFTFRFTAVDTANRDFFFTATYQII